MKICYLIFAALVSINISSQTVKVNGRSSWTDTKINVVKGQTISLSASGTVYANATVASTPDGITNRPDWEQYCVIKGKPHEGLIAKIGNGTPFFVGENYSFTAQESGKFYLGVNDNDLGNNKGEFVVEIKIGVNQKANEIKVPGRQAWTATKICLTIGRNLKIEAKGTVYANATVASTPDGITNRPDWEQYCVIKGKPHEGLIAKIGNGTPFFVGSSYASEANASGELFLGVNDNDLGNNRGEYYATVWTDIKNNGIVVPGNVSWKQTDIMITSGSKVIISATGKVFANATVSCGPAGVLNRPDWDVYSIVKKKPHAGLIAKIGNGEPFFVGETQEFTAKESGVLSLGVNDKDVGNNKGEFNVVVEIK